MPLGGASVEDVTVSRIAAPRLRPYELIKKKPIPRRTGRDMLYGPTPIEMTLKTRQTLQPSTSSPALCTMATTRTLSPPASFPRIAIPDRFHVPVEHVEEDPLLLGVPDFVSPRHAESPSPPRAGTPGTTQDAWHGLVTGGRRVDIPFAQFSEQTAKKDTDRFVHWYRREQDKALQVAQQDGKAKVDEETSKEPVLPWAKLRQQAGMNIEGKLDKSSGYSLFEFGKAELYDFLSEKGPLRGPQALVLAFGYKLGGENNLPLLNVGGDGTLSLLEFAGLSSILGIDVQTVCGAAEQEMFLRLDADRQGVISVETLLAMGLRRRRGRGASTVKKPEGPGVASWHQTAVNLSKEDVHPDAGAAREKWAEIGRWMGTASLRHAALREERVRSGWAVNEAVAGVLGDPLTEAQIAAAPPTSKEQTSPMYGRSRKTAEDGDLQTSSMYGRSPKPEEDDDVQALRKAIGGIRLEVRRRAHPHEVTLEAGFVMRSQERSLKGMFKAHASVKVPDGPELMSRSDLHNFFADLRLADPKCQARVGPGVLDKLFDEAVALQCNFTQIGTGINFWSFKAVLNNAISAFGLHGGWQRLTEIMLEPP